VLTFSGRWRLVFEVVMFRALVLVVVLAQSSPAWSQNCHPSYTGVCVPIASDVDGASGSGNGPEYVDGPVYVVGPDVYGLDRDGDGVACDK